MKRRFHVQQKVVCKGLPHLDWQTVARFWTRRAAEKRAEWWRRTYATRDGCTRQYRVAELVAKRENEESLS